MGFSHDRSLGLYLDAVAAAGYVAVDGAEIRTGNSVADVAGSADAPPSTPDDLIAAAKLELTTEEKDILAGKHGEAAKVAMRIMVRAASCESAPHLLEISQAHIVRFIIFKAVVSCLIAAGLRAQIALPTAFIFAHAVRLRVSVGRLYLHRPRRPPLRKDTR